MHHLGLAFGGRPGQSFARRLVIPVSKDPCCGWSGAAAPRRPASPRWLASMTGLGSGAIVMGQSSAIWNNGGSSTSSLIGRWQLLPSGLPSTPPSPSSPATAGLGLYRRPPRADLKPCRSAAISRILLCSGRVAYDLQAERDRRGASGSGHSYALRNCIHYPQSPSLISSLAPRTLPASGSNRSRTIWRLGLARPSVGEPAARGGWRVTDGELCWSHGRRAVPWRP